MSMSHYFNRQVLLLFTSINTAFPLMKKKPMPCLVTRSCLILCNFMDDGLPGSSVYEILRAKNTRVGCHFLLWGIFPTQGSKPCLLHWQVDSLLLSHLGNPKKKINNME